MKIKLKKILLYCNNIILLIIVLLAVYKLPNIKESLNYIGILIIVVSIYMLFRYRNNSTISLLIGIIMIISICFAMSVCLNTLETAFNWQLDLINLEANIINAKNYLLCLSILSISIGSIDENKIYDNYLNKLNPNYNLLIYWGGFLILIFCLFFGFDRGTIGKYSSNSNPLYEYAIIIYIFVWMYSGKGKLLKEILIIYSFLYCGQGLLFGDRSSAFPMILVIFMLLYKKKIKMNLVLLIGIGGIFLANTFDIFRNSATIDIIKVLDRGLFVNTISYSFYAGTQIIRYSQHVNNPLNHFWQYFMAFFLGKTYKINLSTLANDAGFINKGGGMSESYFYFWGGYLSTIIISFVIGRIINYVFNNDNSCNSILKITITIYVIRWWVYYPIALFRTALLIPLVCFAFCKIFEKLTMSKVRKNVSSVSNNECI